MIKLSPVILLFILMPTLAQAYCETPESSCTDLQYKLEKAKLEEETYHDPQQQEMDRGLNEGLSNLKRDDERRRQEDEQAKRDEQQREDHDRLMRQQTDIDIMQQQQYEQSHHLSPYNQ
jgi:hypothetical protein